MQKNVYACATHGVLSGPAKERLEKSPIQELVLLNTLPIDDEKKLDKMTFISVGPNLLGSYYKGLPGWIRKHFI